MATARVIIEERAILEIQKWYLLAREIPEIMEIMPRNTVVKLSFAVNYSANVITVCEMRATRAEAEDAWR